MQKIFTLFILLVLLAAPDTADAARLWTSGIEQGTVVIDSEFDDVTGTGHSVSTTNVRSGTYSLRTNPTVDQSFVEMYPVTPEIGVAYVRVYLYIASAPNTPTSMLEVNRFENITTVCGLQLNTNRTLQVYADGIDPGDLIGNVSPTLALNTWHRVELLCDSSVVGTFTAAGRLDGTQFASGSMNNGGEAANQVGGITFGVDAGSWGRTATADLYFDDIAMNSTSGGAQTSWPGSGRIVHLRPNAQGDSDPSGCNNTTPCGVPANSYQNIDEVAPNDGTDFIDIDTAISADWNMDNASARGIQPLDTITLVDVGYDAEEEVLATSAMTPRIKSASGGTVSTITAVTLSHTVWNINEDGTNNYVNRFVSYTDPTTGIAWTPTGTNSLDNMQLGVEMTTGTADFDISTLWAAVEYVDNIKRVQLKSGRIKVQGARLKL